MKEERGAVLIITLWTLTLLSMLVLGLAYRMSIELRLTRYQVETIRLHQMAKAALLLSRAAVARSQGYSSSNQAWSHDPERMRDRQVLGGTITWSHEVDSGRAGTSTLHGLSDEESRLNLNTASPEALARIPGLDERLAAAIADWRDPDHEPRAAGTEDYTEYESRNGPFKSIAELLLVKHMTPRSFARARPFLTVHGSGKININTASPEALTALGMKESLLEKIIEFRLGQDREAGTEDDGVFRGLSSLSADLSAQAALGSDELKNLNDLHSDLTVLATAFRMEILARRGRLTRRYTAVFELGKKSEVGYWYDWN